MSHYSTCDECVSVTEKPALQIRLACNCGNGVQ